MANQTLESDPFQITSQQLPGLTRSLNFKTATTFEKDNNNKIIDGSRKTILQYQATPGGIFQAAATSTEGGKAGSWTLINAANSNTPILGQAAINSLQTPNGVLNQETQKSVGIEATKAKLSPEEIKKLSDKTKNQATAETVESLDTGEAVDGTGKSPKDFGNFTYPLDLGKTKQDVIKFSMLEYKPSGLKFIGKSPVSERTGTGSNIIGTVVLPIPSGISDTNACVWGENTLNAATAAAAAAAFAGITKGIGAGVKEAGDSLTKALADPATKTGIAALFTANAVGTDGGAILARTAGAVLNPNLELLFNGPTLRPFSFTFKMSARDKEEAKEIIKILNFFKRGMSPIKTKSNLFLKTPHTFKIQYLHRPKGENTDHPYIGRIKECALQSVVVSYAPEGQYATYSDGVMVSYEMQMQFQELEPIFNSDYEGLSGIGF